MIYQNVLEMVGNTPLIKLNKIAPDYNIYAKAEFANPGGSVKDRIAVNMIEEAEKTGLLSQGDVIIEPTSGNTGIGLAMVGAVKDYKVILVMPESVSEERKKLMELYGAEFILTPKEEGMSGSVEKARTLVEENENYYMPQQFENKANPRAHEKTTAREIAAEFEKLDALVVSAGTGGTLTGNGHVLKKEFPEITIYAGEPEDSPVLSGGEPGSHMIPGMGPGFIPESLDEKVIDEIIDIGNQEAFQMMKEIGQKEGLVVGLSSGANVWAALQVAKKIGSEKNILTFLCDTGERYLSVHSAFEL